MRSAVIRAWRHVRQSWTNDAAPVTPAQVQVVRERTAERKTMWTAAELGR